VRDRTAEEAKKSKEHEEKFGDIVGKGVEGGEDANEPEKRWEEVGMNIYWQKLYEKLVNSGV